MNRILCTLALAIATTTFAQPKPGLTMDRYEGGTVKTELGYNIVLNKGSSLKREWFVIRDSAAPVTIEGPAGFSVAYAERRYEYQASYNLKAKEPIVAVEVRFIVLDVFGQLQKTLSATQLDDVSDVKQSKGSWYIWSETEAASAFASIAYVAQARTASGRVYEANRSAVFEQVRKVAKRITEADLEPKRDPPKQ